ncbi:hypothetical protein [Haloquadratum walsbyi]|uniref:hypothetical protein n=1 Tax=Haloquadratum walsbyi TaxID=293091 RepID=UPI0026F22F3A|nr:hypothetical protein [Haloquadratum walsbyi]
MSSDIRFVPWQANITKEFFQAQFGDHLFAFVLINPEANLVHAGGETVRHLLQDKGVPRPVASTFEQIYQAISDPFGRVVHGQAPADIDGTFCIDESARPHVKTIQRECSLGSCKK